jgi:hypothetical protein
MLNVRYIHNTHETICTGFGSRIDANSNPTIIWFNLFFCVSIYQFSKSTTHLLQRPALRGLQPLNRVYDKNMLLATIINKQQTSVLITTYTRLHFSKFCNQPASDTNHHDRPLRMANESSNYHNRIDCPIENDISQLR